MWQQSFPPVPESVADARHYAVGLIRDQRPETLALVALMVSELASNAVRHAGTPFTVRVSDDRERIDVIDTGPGLPRVERIDPHAAGGRGLRIVEELSGSWGVEHHADTKSVWFTVPGALVRPADLSA
jgi:anti-sigma regulatory factor (Ser/Thr protein kinase)